MKLALVLFFFIIIFLMLSSSCLATTNASYYGRINSYYILACESIVDESTCESAGCYWCDGKCQSDACSVPYVPPSGGGGGAVVLPPTVVVEFIQWEVLREIAQGQATVLGITVKNTGNSSILGLKVEISGIPEEWASVSPKTLNLNPKEKGGFSIAIGIPFNASVGDYRVVMVVSNKGIHSENFMILRVKQFVPEYDKPIFLRVVEIDKELGETNVELTVSNQNRNFSLVQVTEEIPKELANTSDIINFKTRPTEIVRKDPTVQWDLLDLKPSEERKISYSVPKILEEFTRYIYWPLEQVNLITEKIPRVFGIVDVKIPICYSGRTSRLTLTVENPELVSYDFKIAIELPVEWKVEQEYIEGSVGPKERKVFTYDFLVPEKVAPGTYMLRTYLSWNGSEVIKEYSIMVRTLALPKIVIIIIAVVGIAILLIFLKRKMKPKERVFVEKIREMKREVLREE